MRSSSLGHFGTQAESIAALGKVNRQSSPEVRRIGYSLHGSSNSRAPLRFTEIDIIPSQSLLSTK